MSISSLLATDGQTTQKKTLVVGGVVLLLVLSIATVSYAFSDYLKTSALLKGAGSKSVSTPTPVPARKVAAVKTRVVNVSYFDIKEADLKVASHKDGSWSIARVDSAGKVGQDTSLAVDSKGKMHIAYYDDAPHFDLKYATNASGAWVTTVVDGDGNVGWYPSIALDGNDKVYIAYADNSNKDLKFATNASGSWVKSVVDKGVTKIDLPGRYVSLAITKSGVAHIGYQYLTSGTRGNLRYATNANGSWSSVVVDKEINSGYGVSLKMDALGKVHMSYLGNQYPKYANNVGGSWVTTIIEKKAQVGNNTLGFNTSLALDANNKPTACYISGTNIRNYYLKCMVNTSGTWNWSEYGFAVNIAADQLNAKLSKISPELYGTYNSAGYDSDNNLYVSFFNSSKQVLQMISSTKGKWERTTIDDERPTGTWTSLVVSYDYVVPPTPPVPYGPYTPSTPPAPYDPQTPPTPPVPYEPYRSTTITPTPIPPTPTPSEPRISLPCPPPYVDVNGDRKITADDVKPVNAYLNGDRSSVTRTGAGWQNQLDPVDVDGNGVVTPLDSLTVINRVNNGVGIIEDATCVPQPYAAR